MKAMAVGLLALVVVSCAHAPGKKAAVNYVPVALAADESALLASEDAISKRLVQYARCCAIATDSLTARKLNRDRGIYRSCVFAEVGGVPTVFAGSLDGSTFRAYTTVAFGNGGPAVRTPEAPVVDELISRLAVAIQAAADTNEQRFSDWAADFGFWALKVDDSIIVYSSPSHNNEVVLAGGGIKTVFSYSKGWMLSNHTMHLMPMECPAPGEGLPCIRSSSMRPIINEVDIAQSVLNLNQYTEHTIDTGKYLFRIRADTGSPDGYSIAVLSPRQPGP